MKKIKILILCTGNSCRSQMAEGILRHIDPSLDIRSAGVNPALRISSKAVKVMGELGIDIGLQQPKHVDMYVGEEFDYVITVCDNARQTCPVFTGKVGERLHIGFDDPVGASGSEEEVLSFYRRVRDEINIEFRKFYDTEFPEKMSF